MREYFYRIIGRFVHNGSFKRLISAYRWSIIFVVYLLVVFLFFLSRHINILFAVLNVLFIFLVFVLIGKIRVKLVQRIVFFLISFLLSFSITFSVLFCAPLELGNVASILETNLSEIFSLDWQDYLIGVFCLLVTTILSKNTILELNPKISGGKAGVILLLLVFGVNIAAVAVPVYQNFQFVREYKKDLREMPLQTIYTFSSLRLPLLYGDIFALTVYSYEKLDFQRFKNIEKKVPEGILINSAERKISKIYLVVGESAWRERMSLYGYEKKTTPFLDSLARSDSSAILFYDGVSVANMTRDAVRFSLSFASPFDKDAFWKEKNIVEMAKDAGYNTVWLSDQGQAGLYDNYPSYIARSADDTYFEDDLKKKDDLNLLPILDKYHEKGENQFFVLHLMGSHFPYQERYDELDNSYFDYPDSISDYDKSIHHTDRFLNRLYDYTTKQDSNSIIVYYSDHGASPDRGVHGLYGAEISEYRIPLVFLMNNASVNIDSIVSRYLSGEQEGGYINNMNLVYILSELTGYAVSADIVDKAVERGKYIMQVDGAVVLYPSEE